IPLPIRNYPIAVTFANISDKLVVDPWLEEEEVMNAWLTVTYDKDSKICAIQKGGKGALTPQQIIEAAYIAREKSEDLRRLVVENIGQKI
ncbi:MAG: RNA-binding protein, partial [Candidatus Bathyarchaeota archaeon]|nr:RNA-binding protein [Candidatus Bathyarchaeota archaeon]